jgi:hypothetical protein
MGTPDWKPLSPKFYNLKDLNALMRFIVICLIINKKRNNHTKFVSTYLKWYTDCLSLMCNEDRVFRQSMRVFVGNQTPTGEMIQQKCVSLIEEIIASNPPKYELGVVIHDNFGVDNNAYFHTDHQNWNSTFQHVWERMFPSERNGVQMHDFFYVLMNSRMNSSVRNQAIVTRTAMTNPQPFVPARLTHSLYARVQSVHKQSVPAKVLESLPESHPLMCRLDKTQVNDFHNPPMSLPVQPENDATVSLLPVVKSVLADCVANVIIKSAGAIDARNKAVLSHILCEDSDVNALRYEVASQATKDESAAITDASTALEVKKLVEAAADAGESLFQDPAPDLGSLSDSVEHTQVPSPVSIVDIPVSPTDYFPPASSEIPSLKNVTHGGDADSAALFEAAMNFPITSLSVHHQLDRQNHANGAGGPFSVIQKEEDGAGQSGTSPLPLNGKRQAPFTTLSLSSLHSVEIGALRAEPESSSSNLGSNPSSGPSGTTQTHELQEFLKSLAISSNPSFKPAADTSCDGSNLAQSSGNPLEHVLEPPNLQASLEEPPPLPSRSSHLGGKIGERGMQLSSNPIRNLPGIVLSNVDVSRNPRANLPSFPPRGDVGGSQVQVLASSKNPTGNSGGADHPKSPSSSKLGSDSSKDGTVLSASLLKVPNDFGTSRLVLLLKSKSSSPSKSNGIGCSPLTAHPSGNPLVIAPSSAPPLSSELGSAATETAAPPPTEKPPTVWGVDIGGTKHSGEMLDIAMVLLLAARCVQHGRGTIVQAPLFSNIPPSILLKAGRVA